MAPIQEASTVHTTITDSAVIVVELGARTAGEFGVGDIFTIDCTAAYRVVGLNFDFGAGTFIGDSLAVAVGGDDIHKGLSLAIGGIDALHGSEISAVATDDVTITFTLTDNTDETISNARASIVTTGSCTFVDT